MLDQQLILGKTYRLRFKGIFEPHGVCSTTGLTCLHKGNGTFRLEQIASFNDIVLAGIKLYDNFFATVNVSQEEYEAYFSSKPDDEYTKEYDVKTVYNETKDYVTEKDATTGQLTVRTQTKVTSKEVFVETGKSVLQKHARDRVNYANYPIYKFVDVQDDTDILYVPELTIDGFPEIEISEYKDLNLVIHLGYYDKPELLDPMLLAIRERMATYGVKPKHIKMYSTGSKWMNPDEYEAIKTIRVPADVSTIPEDAKIEDYLHLHVIVNGMLKEIVETVDEGMEDEQVAFSALKSGTVLIDPTLFMEDVNPGDKFDALKLYYQKMEDGSWHFMSDDECPEGEEIMQFVPWVGAPVEGKKYYQAVTGDFVQVGQDEARTGMTVDTERRVYTNTFLNPETYFWTKSTTSIDGAEPTTVWKTAIAADIADTSLPLYRKMVVDYVEYSDYSYSLSGAVQRYVSSPRAALTYYKKTTDVTVVTGKTYYRLDTDTSTYEKVLNPTGNPSEQGWYEQRCVYGTGEYQYANYVKQDVLMLIGDTFTYVNDFDQTKTNVLDMADIIDFGMKVKQTTLYYDLDKPSQAQIRAWNEWKGRRFRYYKNYGTEDAPLWVCVETTIPETPTSNFVGKTGEIVGQKGLVSKSLYFCKDTTVKRNYYMQYAILKHQYNVLLDKYNALEKHILAVAQRESS